MPIEYNPDDAVQVWPEGEYPATLVSVADRTFKSGNSGQEWVVTVFDNQNDRKMTITDRVVVPGATFKIQDLARAVGQEEAFKRGLFQPEDHTESTFIVAIKIEKSDGYPDKNVIKKYKSPVRPAGRTASAPVPASKRAQPNKAKEMLDAPAKTAAQVAEEMPSDESIPF